MWPPIHMPKPQLQEVYQNMTVFGNRVFKEIVKSKGGHRVGPNPIGLMSF